MAYMVMQRYTTAIHEGYGGRADVTEQLRTATAFRTWIESLAIDPAIRNELAEPIRAVEDALADLERAPAAHRAGGQPGR